MLKYRKNQNKEMQMKFPDVLLYFSVYEPLLAVTEFTGQHTVNKKFQRTIVNVFLPIISICFGCSKEPSHRDGSFEFPQHMFWLRNKKMKFLESKGDFGT